MSRDPDERDMEQMVRSWVRGEAEHPANRNRQVGRIMGRIDETRQRRGAWRFLPFGRGRKRIDKDDEELFVAGAGAVAMRRGVSVAMAVAAVAVLIVIGSAFIALVPRTMEAGPGARPSPQATIHPDDEAVRAAFAGTWSGRRTSLDDVVEIYAEDAVHTSLWFDEVERFEGPLEIWNRIQESSGVDAGDWVRLPDSAAGEHRYLSVTENLGGIACVFWIRERLITRHDCILPGSNLSPAMPVHPPASEQSLEVWDAIKADFSPGWATADRELIEQAVSPEIVHHVAYDNAETTLEGIDAYMSVTGYGEPDELATPEALPAPDGQHRWTDFTDIGGGTLCTFWERDGLIIRHDCIVPTSTRGRVGASPK